MRLLLEKQLFRYLAVGGIAYLIEMASLYALKRVGFNSLQAVAMSFWIGLVAAFVLQKTITFQDKRVDRKVLFNQATIYLLLVAFNYLFTMGTVALAGGWINIFVLRTLIIGLTTIWNYLIYKYIFR